MENIQEHELPEKHDSSSEVVRGFIVGMSRAGTTWMGKTLDRHPDVAVIGETGFWGRNYLLPGADGCYSVSQLQTIIKRLKDRGLTATMSDVDDPAARLARHGHRREVVAQALTQDLRPMVPKDVFSVICHAVVSDEGKRWALEKTPHHINWIERMITVYSDARFIVMYRDPYGFMLSYRHQADRKPEHIKRNIRRMYHPLGCALVWKGYARATVRVLKKYPEKCLLVEYSRLRTQPEKLLDEVQDFLQIDGVHDLVVPRDNSSFPGGVIPELEMVDRFWMNLVARKEIKLLGFQKRGSGFVLVPAVVSILTLPVWVSRVAMKFMVGDRASPLSYLASWFQTKKDG